MSDMKTVRLAEVLSIEKGKKITPSASPTAIRYIQIEDLRGEANMKWAEEEQQVVACDVNDVLLAWDGANAGEFGYGLKGAVGSTLAKLSPLNGSTHTPYLGHFLKSKTPYLRSKCTGATIPHVNRRVLEDIEIPLPPLPTQRRIAAVLDKAQALVANDRQTLALYDQLAKSLFLEMFGDPVSNERGWEVVKLGDVVTDVIGGESVGGDERPLEKGEWAVLKISAVTRGVFDAKEYKVADISQLKRAPVVPKRGDLLFSRANTREMVGATCVVNHDCTNLFLPDKLWRLDLDPAATHAWYLHHLLHHEAFRASTLGSLATGTSGSMLNISKAKLLGMGIPLPPSKDQRRFADGIEAINTQRAQAEQSLRQSEGLFGSLLQEAFSGKL